MEVKEMYNIAHRIGTHGIEGYDVANKYEDSMQPKRGITHSLTSLNIKNKPLTDRASYLREMERASRHVPGPGAYRLPDEFDVGAKIKTSKSTSSHKKTYVDEIILRAKRQKFPAPGQYDHELIEKQFNKKKEITGDKITYLDEVQYEADQTPGPGAYNPHVYSKLSQQAQSYTHIVKRDPTYWINKALEKDKRKPLKQPDVGTYHPNSVSYRLFGDSSARENKPKPDFSKDSRFQEDRPKKSKLLDPPGPGAYPIQGRWRGKSDSKKNVNILDKISYPPVRSIYY